MFGIYFYCISVKVESSLMQCLCLHRSESPPLSYYFLLKACGERRFFEYINYDMTQAQFKAVIVNQT